ncbi:hypothetical protein PRIPAC_96742 [Pristionchus pacificus]|uniref:Uncharacterized protein n=1 Tax=Pristionchus pacificus TaxID=54126 RepID=A0A454XLZ2_PRIPA|nr:hypothetical protein PRIPAC_96742 [Pristionchus pacificus]|eukprot:PDM63630.1 hypothetical protein PRIPAC_49603 [Pristionchus pacificus]
MLLLRSLSYVALIALFGCTHANDAAFRMCGTKLLQHVMDHNLCDPNAPRCKEVFPPTPEKALEIVDTATPSPVFSSRARRGADSKLISTMCCTNMCRPSDIQKVCCGN